MSKLVIYAAAGLALIIGIGAYIESIKSAERQKVIAEQIAKTNQTIAERRVTDAEFDKLDAAALCRDAGLEWLQIDGRSQCQ